jgi:hypothetical protein
MKHSIKTATIFGSLVGLGLLAAVVPSLAQYYPYPQPRPYYEPAPRPYYQPNPYQGGGYYQPYRPVVIGNICVTSRGSCQTRPRPENSSCGCNIPGFGPKRGAVVSQRGW